AAGPVAADQETPSSEETHAPADAWSPSTTLPTATSPTGEVTTASIVPSWRLFVSSERLQRRPSFDHHAAARREPPSRDRPTATNPAWVATTSVISPLRGSAYGPTANSGASGTRRQVLASSDVQMAPWQVERLGAQPSPTATRRLAVATASMTPKGSWNERCRATGAHARVAADGDPTGAAEGAIEAAGGAGWGAAAASGRRRCRAR